MEEINEMKQNVMKHIPLILIIILAGIVCGHSAPIGICVFAENQQTPAEQAQAFEIKTYETTTDSIRCFPIQGGSVVVPKSKLRGIIPYPKSISGTDPGLPAQLESFKGYAAKYPATQVFLKPWIDKMTDAHGVSSKIASLPTLKIGTTTILAPSFSKVRDGKVFLKHNDGFASFTFKELSDSDIEAINKLSDGKWKLCRPMLSGFDSSKNKYRELTLSNGERHRQVSLNGFDNGVVVFKTSSKDLSLSLLDVATLSGMADIDRKKIDGWVKEVAQERLKRDEIARKEEEKQDAINQKNAATLAKARSAVIEVIESHNDGVLCKVAYFHKETMTDWHNNSNGRSTRTESQVDSLDVLSDRPMFVVGVLGAVDGAVLQTKLIETGQNFSYITVTGSRATVPKLRAIGQPKKYEGFIYRDTDVAPRVSSSQSVGGG